MEEIINQFLKKYPGYAERETAWGACYQASVRLRRFLRAAGIKAHLLHCQNFRLKDLRRVHPATVRLCPDTELWNHFVVCAMLPKDVKVLDPTAKQFDRKYPAVRVMNLCELQDEWLYYRQYPGAGR